MVNLDLLISLVAFVLGLIAGALLSGKDRSLFYEHFVLGGKLWVVESNKRFDLDTFFILLQKLMRKYDVNGIDFAIITDLKARGFNVYKLNIMDNIETEDEEEGEED